MVREHEPIHFNLGVQLEMKESVPTASICPSSFYINSKNETEYHAVSKMASIPSQTESMTSIGGKNVDTLPWRA